MRSFLTVQPGETLSCVGCHEHRTEAAGRNSELLALRRPPSAVRPVPGTPDVFDFPRDIQPILDRHCLRCHDYDRPEGGAVLCGDRGPFFSHSFWTLTVRGQFSDGRNQAGGNDPPRAFGSAASRLMGKLDGRHFEAKLTPHERTMVRLWIDSGAPYAGTYAALGTGMLGPYRQDVLVRNDVDWPAVKAARAVLQGRCAACHTGPMQLPSSPSDDLDMPPWQSRFNDPRTRFSRHILYNLTRPEKSLLLLAPLAKQAGGYGVCAKGETGHRGQDVFAGTRDPDYQTLLESILEAQRALATMKRFDMPGFRPGAEYLREMKRYGIIPAGLRPESPIDVYATDRAYWESLWHKPAGLYDDKQVK